LEIKMGRRGVREEARRVEERKPEHAPTTWPVDEAINRAISPKREINFMSSGGLWRRLEEKNTGNRTEKRVSKNVTLAEKSNCPKTSV
jgi:hypothetical protein